MSKNIYTTSENPEEFVETIREQRDKGYELIDAESGDDIIFGVFEKASGLRGLTSGVDYNQLTTKINTSWEQGLDIVKAEYIEGQWLGILQEHDGGNAYTNSPVTLDTLTGQINSQWDNGFKLVDVEYSDNGWVGIYGKKFGANNYGFADSLEEFNSQFNSQFNQGRGLDLVGVEYGDGKWFGIYHNTPSFSGYSTASSLDEFETQIANWEEHGYELIDVGYGDGTWMGVYETTTAYSIGLYSTIGFIEHEQAMQGIEAVSAGADSLGG